MAFTNLNRLLLGYGLTLNQVKVFSTLINNNNSMTAKQISQFSGLARETVYRNLLDLKQMGLLEKTIKFPKKYHAISLKSAIQILHDEKKIKINELEDLAAQVLSEHNKNREKKPTQKSNEFILIPKKTQLFKRISDAFYNSKKNIKCITSWNRHRKSFIVYESAINQALTNGTTFQVIITESKKNLVPTKVSQYFYDHSNTFVKFVEDSSKIILILVDDKEIFLMTEPKATLLESPALWSNNPSLILALTMGFDSIWKESHSIS